MTSPDGCSLTTDPVVIRNEEWYLLGKNPDPYLFGYPGTIEVEMGYQGGDILLQGNAADTLPVYLIFYGNFPASRKNLIQTFLST